MRITAHDDQFKLLRGVDHAVRQTTVGKFVVSSYALIGTNPMNCPGRKPASTTKVSIPVISMSLPYPANF